MEGIRRYVRTAVVIDDRLEESAVRPEVLERIEGTRTDPQPGLVRPPDDDETPIYWQSLVRAFLEHDVVCSVVRPSRESNVVDLALRSVYIADLLILDWLLFKSDQRAVDAIRKIVEEVHDRLTIVAVYTGDPKLTSVVERLQRDVGLIEYGSESFVLRQGNTLVLVFSKPTVDVLGAGRSRRAEYSDLPSKIHEDLDFVLGGVLPELVFEAVGILRDSVPRVLSTFDASLDPAVLIHRALLPSPSDAGIQFLKLVMDDLEGALIERGTADTWNTTSVRQYLSKTDVIKNPKALADTLKRSPRTPFDTDTMSRHEIVGEAIALGLYNAGMKKKKIEKRAGELVEAFGDVADVNRRLAALMSSSNFGGARPTLEIGVVLKHQDMGSYWLCIQPRCDSTNLGHEEPRAFPMIPLDCSDSSQGLAIIVDDEGHPVTVNVRANPYRLILPNFKPTTSGKVVAERMDSERAEWYFESMDCGTFGVVTRLRFDVALEAVQQFATKASRPGVNASELFRRGMM